MDCCYSKAERKIGSLFESYGRIIYRNPIPAIIFSILLNGFLGVNIRWIQTETRFDELYAPRNTQADNDEQKIKFMLPADFSQNFYHYQQADNGFYGRVLFKTDGNVINENYRKTISAFNKKVLSLKVEDTTGNVFTYKDLCQKNNGACYTFGSLYLDESFWVDFLAGNVHYPKYGGNRNFLGRIDGIFGNVQTENGVLLSANSLLMTYYLRKDTDKLRALSLAWENEFANLNLMANDTAIFISTSQSLENEVLKNTVWDPIWFSLVFCIMSSYAFITTVGGNCLTQRGNLGVAGVLSSCLAILGGYGLCAAADVKNENMVSLMPFLVLGVGLRNTYLLLSGLTDAPLQGSVEVRICHAMKTSGVSMTISSVTDVCAFLFGLMSELLSIQNFCIYTGTAVILSFINELTFVLACTVLHEKRIADSRHSCTCRIVYTPDEMKSAGYRNKAFFLCCSGGPAENKDDLQSFSEKLPARGIPKALLNIPFKVIILLIYIGYVGISIFGILDVDQNFQMRKTLRESSYLYEFDEAYDESFPNAFVVSLNIDGGHDYRDFDVIDQLANLTKNARRSKYFDDNFELNWLKEYINQGYQFNSSKSEFVDKVKLFIEKNPMYKNDIVFDDNGTQIIWTRLYLFTKEMKHSRDIGKLIEYVRKLTDESLLDVFAYGTTFSYFQQYVSVITKTIQTVGISFAVCVFVVSIFLMHPFMIFLVVFSMVSIMIGVIGFMSFWNIDLNSFTTTYLTISVGFCCNYCASMCYWFMKSEGTERKMRTFNALQRMVGPILYSAIYLIIGLCILLFSESYIYITFFKMVVLVIFFGIFHSMFVLPVILSLVGPRQTGNISRQTSVSKTPLFPNRSSASWSINTGVNALDDIFYGKKSKNPPPYGQKL